MGGNFANWGLMFSVFDCTFLYLRQKVSRPVSAFQDNALSTGVVQQHVELASAPDPGALLMQRPCSSFIRC